MVNPLMCAKLEPLGAMGTSGEGPGGGHGVKLELDQQEAEDDNKIEVKMEVLDELFGYGFGCVSNLLGDGDHKELLLGGETTLTPLGPPPSYPGTPSQGVVDLPGGGSTPPVRTVKVPLHTESVATAEEGGGPGGFPVLSIPGSFAGGPSLLSSPPGGLHISISPCQGPDTTTITSPTAAGHTSICSSNSQNKKTVFTAKGTASMIQSHSTLSAVSQKSAVDVARRGRKPARG